MALFDKLSSRAEAHTTSAVERIGDAVEHVAAGFPDISLHREGDVLMLSGRGLMRRWLGDVRLRFWRQG